jgi:antitoxin component of MazEF toxin-antitoxin module
MIRLKVRRFGKSLGIILPNEVIDHLHTKAGETLLLIEAPEGTYRLTHKMAIAGDIINRYRNTLDALTK